MPTINEDLFNTTIKLNNKVGNNKMSFRIKECKWIHKKITEMISSKQRISNSEMLSCQTIIEIPREK